MQEDKVPAYNHERSIKHSVGGARPTGDTLLMSDEETVARETHQQILDAGRYEDNRKP